MSLRGISPLLNRRLLMFAAALGAIGVILWALDRAFPLKLPQRNDGVVVLAADGTPLRTYPTRDGIWRQWVAPSDVSPLYLDALFGYEDRHFHRHPGVNPGSILRAAWQWLRNGEIVSGGSTLSMQVARILDGPAPRTLWSKSKQIARALQLEWHLSKTEILTLYINHAPMGGIVEGVEMASRSYFGKSARNLSHAEAALLAVLPQSPTRHRPDLHPAAAQAARDKVLRRMAAIDVWTSDLVADARIERVLVPMARPSWRAPLAAERLRTDATSATVRSTIDAELQARIETILADRARMLPPKVSIAVLVMENESLAVRAYAGSADFNDQDRYAHVDMTRAVRSPGSTLKPFLYAMALDEGLIHSESLLLDVPQSFDGYAPGNFQAAFSGPVSVADALQRSLNVPAVDLLDRVGPAQFAARLRNAGVHLRMEAGADPNLSLILGGAGTTLEELVGAYRALAAGGLAGKPRLQPEAPKIETRMMSAGAAWIVREILESGGRPGRPFEDSGSRGGFAWKTGTSFGFRDAWTIGVTEGHTIGVWIGRPDGTPNPGFFGANSAAPLAQDIAVTLHTTLVRAKAPHSVKALAICWPLGLAREATPEGMCHSLRHAWILDNTVAPTLPDRAHPGPLLVDLYIDPKNGARVSPLCEPRAQALRAARWPQQLEPWLSGEMLQLARMPAWRKDCAPRTRETTLIMQGVADGGIVHAARDAQSARVKISVIGTHRPVHWLLNGELVATLAADQAFSFDMRRDGPYTLTALDDEGRYVRTAFEARGFGAQPVQTELNRESFTNTASRQHASGR